MKKLPSVWLVQVAGWTTFGLLCFLSFLPMVSTGECILFAQMKLVMASLGCVTSAALIPLYRSMRRRGVTRASVVLAIVACTALGVVWAAANDTIQYLVLNELNWVKTRATFALHTLDYATTLMAWSAAYFGITAWDGWQRERARALRADALAQAARLESLRYQLHPHFLFNALNSVRALIDEEPKRARRVLSEMADFYRYSLATADRPLVPLAEELAALQSYLAIEQTRYEDKLDVRFAVGDSARDRLVPVLILHPLIENAVKHGFASGAVPLTVTISAELHGDTLSMSVVNTLGERAGTSSIHASLNAKPAGTGTGLRNVRERLLQLYGDAARFALGTGGGRACAEIVIDRASRAQEGDDARAAG